MARKQRAHFKSRLKTVFRKPDTRFRKWRKYRGMTLERAAELSGMSVGNISAMEREAQGFTQDGLYALAKAYEVNPGWLLDYDPEEITELMLIWESAKSGDRAKIVEIAKTITGKTGTGG